MKYIIWNVGGLRTSLHRLKRLVQKHHIQLLIIIEPKQSADKIIRLQLKLSFTNSIVTCSDNIWVFWQRTSLQLDNVFHGEQISLLQFCTGQLGHHISISPVYGRHTVTDRRRLWLQVHQYTHHAHDLWLVGGDFNTYMSVQEHHGTSMPQLSSLEEFVDCVSQCSLIDLPYDGSPYTWVGGRGLGIVKRRLDRILCTQRFYDQFPMVKVKHLSRITSDHAPLLLNLNVQSDTTPRSFRFLNVWTEHNDFLKFVAGQWSTYPTIGGMRGMYNKLQSLKKDLQHWNKQVFGNIFDKLAAVEREANIQEAIYDSNPTMENRAKYHQVKAEYLKAANYEQKFWEQKARCKWLMQGDGNTSYFHNLVKDRHRRQSITQIKTTAGDICQTKEAIQAEAVSYFTQLYKRFNPNVGDRL